MRDDDVGFVPGGVSRWLAWRVLCFSVVVIVTSAVCVGILLWMLLAYQTPATSGQGGGGSISLWPILSVSGSMIVMTLFGMLYLFGVHRHAKKTAARCSGFACPRCLYDLSADETDRCPECGQRVVHAALPSLWMMGKKEEGDGEFDATGFDSLGRSRAEVRYGRVGMLFAVLIPAVGFLPQSVQHFPFASGWSVGNRFLVSLLPGIFLMGVLVIAMIVYGLRVKRRFRDALWASGGIACPRCLHDLSGAEVDRCPECEQMVDYSTLGRKWAVRMKVLKIEPSEGGGDDGGL